MWGKLAERNNRPKPKMNSDPQEIFRFLATTGIDVTILIFASDDVFWDSWRYIDDEKVTCLRHINEVIGAYVTAATRLHLHPYLDRLQEKSLYTDTDCIFYIQKDNEPALIPYVDKLGDMIRELKPGEHVIELPIQGR
jgi:hypothetical protein